MPKFATSESWANLDTDGLVWNWTVDQDGVDRRLGASANAGKIVAHGVNHVLAYTPRPIFWRCLPRTAGTQAELDASNSIDPLYYFTYHDNVHNARTLTMSVLYVPREANGYATNAYLACNIFGSANTGWVHPSANVVNYYDDAGITAASISRNNETNTLVYGSVSVTGGILPLDVIIYEDSITDGLDSEQNHAYADPAAFTSTRPVTTNATLQMRQAFHDHRRFNGPTVLFWTGAVSSTPPSAPGDKYLIRTSNVNLASIWDRDYGFRNATSPGIPTCAYRMGYGPHLKEHGQRVPVECRVYASFAGDDGATNATNATVLFSTAYSNAWVNVTAAGWHTANSYLYLNSAFDTLVGSANENKVDILAAKGNSNTDLAILTISGVVVAGGQG